MKRQFGFTLMELLIVIAIIGILVSVSVVSYSSAQRKGRDSRRHSDIKAMQNAWEQYYADNNGNYPTNCGFESGAGSITSAYLPGGLPVDPKTGTTYVTMKSSWATCTAATYCLCAGLEGETNTTTDCAGNTPSSNGYAGMFCVRSLQ